ncbi:uncharacterized protein LOC121860779 [Homarus americanus]|uniref:uncharacterized protein LOC121860779 n=1 Tax=Homarus americanus TaxID=6706 RepID=UPI001C46B56D|nr:uncharacterized protein LOC121860779 [Homarus americanus]
MNVTMEDLEETYGDATMTEISLEKRLASRWEYYSKVLMGLARNPDAAAGIMGLNASIFRAAFRPPPNTAMHNFTVDLTAQVRRRDDPGRMVIIILAYSIIIGVSLFGNLLVCHVVVRTRRLHTLTNTFLANLALSDLLMTALNIPFNVARVLLDDWPFGGLMCSMVPFVQVISVYVSAFTMVAIALDRYQVIVHPLKPRLGAWHGAVIITVVWLLAALVSLPYAIYSQVMEVFTYRKLTRCQAHYPSPALQFRQWLTLATFLTQYVVPLGVTAVAYVGVTRRVWWRAVVGAATQEQLSLQLKTKKKTVKMLVVVVVLFALCWMPLNTYHLVVDFGVTVGPSRHSSTVFFICHWFAMSNVCYNPFIYCWLNDHFRAGAKAWLWCAARKLCHVPLPHDDDEPQGVRISRPRGSVTLSSSALASGSVSRKLVGGVGSVRSTHHHHHRHQASDFHVALDELINTPMPSRRSQHSFKSNSSLRGSKQRQKTNTKPNIGEPRGVHSDKSSSPKVVSITQGLQDASSVVSCTHGNLSSSFSEMPCIEVDLPCVLNLRQISPQPPEVLQVTSPHSKVDEISSNLREEEATEEPEGNRDDWRNKTRSRSEKDAIDVEKLDIVYVESERLPTDPTLGPIPEESPRTSCPRTLIRCPTSPSAQHSLPQSQLSLYASEVPESKNISHLTAKSSLERSNNKSLNGDSDPIVPSPITPTQHSVTISKTKQTKNPITIIRAIRDITVSLARRLTALTSRNSSSRSTSKMSHDTRGRTCTPSLCWTEGETSTNPVSVKSSPITALNQEDTVTNLTKFSKCRECRSPATTQRDDHHQVTLPNIVLADTRDAHTLPGPQFSDQQSEETDSPRGPDSRLSPSCRGSHSVSSPSGHGSPQRLPGHGASGVAMVDPAAIILRPLHNSRTHVSGSRSGLYDFSLPSQTHISHISWPVSPRYIHTRKNEGEIRLLSHIPVTKGDTAPPDATRLTNNSNTPENRNSPSSSHELSVFLTTKDNTLHATESSPNNKSFRSSFHGLSLTSRVSQADTCDSSKSTTDSSSSSSDDQGGRTSPRSTRYSLRTHSTPELCSIPHGSTVAPELGVHSNSTTTSWTVRFSSPSTRVSPDGTSSPTLCRPCWTAPPGPSHHHEDVSSQELTSTP